MFTGDQIGWVSLFIFSWEYKCRDRVRANFPVHVKQDFCLLACCLFVYWTIVIGITSKQI